MWSWQETSRFKLHDFYGVLFSYHRIGCNCDLQEVSKSPCSQWAGICPGIYRSRRCSLPFKAWWGVSQPIWRRGKHRLCGLHAGDLSPLSSPTLKGAFRGQKSGYKPHLELLFHAFSNHFNLLPRSRPGPAGPGRDPGERSLYSRALVPVHTSKGIGLAWLYIGGHQVEGQISPTSNSSWPSPSQSV